MLLILLALPGVGRATTPFSLLTRTDLPVGYQNAVAIADFNGDGRGDMAGVYNASSVSVFLGHGDGTFDPATTFPLGQSSAQGVTAADVNGDGKTDHLFCGGSSTLSVLLGNGDGTFAAPLTVTSGPGAGPFVRVADFNQDGRADAFVGGFGAYVRLGNGDGTFGPRLDVSATGCVNGEPMIGDFNGDGRMDLALPNPCPFGKISVLLGNGNGTFQPQVDYPVPSLPSFSDAGDLNGDGRLDLVVVTQNGVLSVLLGNGDGTFAPRTDTTISSETLGAKIRDFNADGIPDIAVTGFDVDILFLLAGRGDGTFEPPIGFPTGHRPHDVFVGDLNQDGRPDLVTSVVDVAQFINGLSVFLNPVGPAAGSAPVLTAPASVTVTENSTVSFTVTASDPDGPAIAKLFDDVDLAGRTFTVNAQNTSADWSWTPIAEGGAQHTIIFTARNNLAGIAITHIQVDKIVSANAPVLAQPSDMTASEGARPDQTLTATDADGDPLTFSKVSGPSFVTVTTVSQGTGSATGNLHLAPGPNDAGLYAVTVRAADHALNDDKSLAITINDSPGMPLLAPIASMSVCVGHTADQAISATDPDADAITFTSSGPPWMTVSSSPQAGTTRTGSIHLAPFSDFGSFQGTVNATAGGLTDSRTFSILVGQCNFPPVLAQPANMTVAEGATADQTLNANDANGSPLFFTKVAGPLFMTVTTTTAGAGTATGNVHLAPGFSDGGSYATTVRASDGSLTNDKSSTITVLQVCRPPVARAGGPYTGFVNVPVAFDGGGSSDPDGAPLTYAWDFGDGATGTGVTPQHTYTAMATYTVTLMVTGACGTASDATTATIQDACPAIAFTKGGNRILRLNSSRPTLCVQVEPTTGCYRNEDVLLASLVMTFTGGAVTEIHAITGKTTVDTDVNNNGIAEIAACFRKEDLRQLFSGLNGTNDVTVNLQGDLSTGGAFRAALALRVIAGGGTAVTVAPNPFNPSSILTFATTRPGPAKLEMFDTAGRIVRMILDDPELAAGIHDVPVDGRSKSGTRLASGIYFIRASTTEGTFSTTVTILK